MLAEAEARAALSVIREIGGADIAATDTGAARVFAALYAPTARYVAGLGWYVWGETERGGGHWAEDGGLVRVAGLVERMAGLYMQAATDLLPTDKAGAAKLAGFALAVMNNGRKNAVLREAERQPGLFCAEYPFDLDPLLLNTQSGVVDLRTGALRQAEPALMCARITSAAYDPGARADRWQRFLDEVFGGDSEVIGFARRWLGYCMSASNAEQKYLVAFGQGSNGKSVLFETVLNALGSYGVTLRPDVITLRRDGGDVPTPALAELIGRRLAVLPEWVRGRAIDEVLIKSIVGGDTVQGRRLYSDPFTFKATAKLTIYGNSKPELRGRDWGTWRRVLLLPFNERFGTNGRPADPHLSARLADERDGILGDLVRGAGEWLAGGLRVPAQIAAATESYRDEIDDVRAFVKAACVTRADARTKLADLRKAYEDWGGEVSDPRQLSRALRELGFNVKHRRDGANVLGLGLLAGD